MKLSFGKPRIVGAFEEADLERLIDFHYMQSLKAEVVYDLDDNVERHDPVICYQGAKLVGAMIAKLECGIYPCDITNIYFSSVPVVPGSTQNKPKVHVDPGVYLSGATALSTRFYYGTVRNFNVPPTLDPENITEVFYTELSAHKHPPEHYGLQVFSAEPLEVVEFGRRNPHEPVVNETNATIDRGWLTVKTA